MPMTPFIGVRISWLIMARNWLLAWLARVAASMEQRACSMASSSWMLAPRSSAVRSSTRARARLRELTSARTSNELRMAVVVPPIKVTIGSARWLKASNSGRE